MTDLAAFLIARIAEDEAWWHVRQQTEPKAPELLADCAAKRQLLNLHQPRPHSVLPPVCEWCGPDTAVDLDGQWPCLHLKLLAAPYADHPDYRQEWRP